MSYAQVWRKRSEGYTFMAAIIYKESLPTNNMKDGNTNIKMSNRHYTKLPISHSELPSYSFVCIVMAGRISVSRILGNHTPMRRIPVWLLKVKEKQKSLLILKLYWAGMKCSVKCTFEVWPGASGCPILYWCFRQLNSLYFLIFLSLQISWKQVTAFPGFFPIFPVL